jgi:putative endonuclease
MMNHTDLGGQGEEAAATYLKKYCHYTIIKRNYRTRIGEIDIIAKDKDILVFVEVKTRRNEHCGRPSESVERRKQWKLQRVALTYLTQYACWNRPCRFDVIEVFFQESSGFTLNHIRNAFIVSS